MQTDNTVPQPAQQEPIYQMQMMDGKWIDQAKQSYEYNKAQGHTVRIVYATPQPAQPGREALEAAHTRLQKRYGELEEKVLAVLAQQEPVGYLYEGIEYHTKGTRQFSEKQVRNLEARWWRFVGPVYTTPQPQPPQRQTLTDEQSRKLFAAFVKKNLGDIAVMYDGHYISHKINNYWLVWQEALGITKGGAA